VEKSKLTTQLSDAVKFGVTTDMWMHYKTNDAYITVTAQYVDSAWFVSSFVLATHAVEDKHTAEWLHAAFLLYFSWILQVWYNFVDRNMNRHKKFGCGNGVGMGIMSVGIG